MVAAPWDDAAWLTGTALAGAGLLNPGTDEATRTEVGSLTTGGTALTEATLATEAAFLVASLETTLSTDETGMGNGRAPEFDWDPEDVTGVPSEVPLLGELESDGFVDGG